ncbi:class I glutamine amidotransferase-like protein, partial [Clavulina sp. PMI_390]
MRLSSSFLGLLTLAAFATASPLAKILIFSRTLGYRHDSIPTAISQLKAHGPSASPTAIQFDATEDPTFFTSGNLSQYDALLFLMTTDSSDTPRVEVLDSDQKTAFLNYLGAGGNYIGIHAASDSLTSTPFFGNETGAYFDYHPALQNGTVVVLNASNPATSSMPTRWNYEEEFYNFKSDPRTLGATVLLTVDESTYTDTGTRKYDEGTPHPLAWVQDHGAGASFASPAPSTSATGRSFYTSLGHLNSTWETSTYMDHVMGGIGWALLSNTTLAFSA